MSAKKKSLKLYLLIFVFTVLAVVWIGISDLLLTNHLKKHFRYGIMAIFPFLRKHLLRVISRMDDFGIKPNIERKTLYGYFTALLIYPFVTVITISISLILE
ncbi:hypothetical protein CW304_14135 [Bacillus sp. UFRGS-B20]|nr:hypothetical protein CW304_14135 [Bacillus sp. UFRGS-B20]